MGDRRLYVVQPSRSEGRPTRPSVLASQPSSASRPRREPGNAGWTRIILRPFGPSGGNEAPVPAELLAVQLELRHRRHARVENSIKTLRATGLDRMPFRRFAANEAWLEPSGVFS